MRRITSTFGQTKEMANYLSKMLNWKPGIAFFITCEVVREGSSSYVVAVNIQH